jgi:hypothetical protein
MHVHVILLDLVRARAQATAEKTLVQHSLQHYLGTSLSARQVVCLATVGALCHGVLHIATLESGVFEQNLNWAVPLPESWVPNLYNRSPSIDGGLGGAFVM